MIPTMRSSRLRAETRIDESDETSRIFGKQEVGPDHDSMCGLGLSISGQPVTQQRSGNYGGVDPGEKG
jgi:hypothetical protein